MALLTMILFNDCYMFRPTYGTSSGSLILLLNCPNMDLYQCYSSQFIQYMEPSRSYKNVSNFKIFQKLKLKFKII
jgi:hypothetical protein